MPRPCKATQWLPPQPQSHERGRESFHSIFWPQHSLQHEAVVESTVHGRGRAPSCALSCDVERARHGDPYLSCRRQGLNGPRRNPTSSFPFSPPGRSWPRRPHRILPIPIRSPQSAHRLFNPATRAGNPRPRIVFQTRFSRVSRRPNPAPRSRRRSPAAASPTLDTSRHSPSSASA